MLHILDVEMIVPMTKLQFYLEVEGRACQSLYYLVKFVGLIVFML